MMKNDVFVDRKKLDINASLDSLRIDIIINDLSDELVIQTFADKLVVDGYLIYANNENNRLHSKLSYVYCHITNLLLGDARRRGSLAQIFGSQPDQ